MLLPGRGLYRVHIGMQSYAKVYRGTQGLDLHEEDQ